jgi:hypothetical protein
MDERCDHCRFFKGPNPVPDSAFVPDFARVPGQCRRYPAVAFHHGDHWCGEFKAAAKPKGSP